MAFKIPQPIKELAAPLAAQASRAYSEPKEGKLIIPIEIDWDGNGTTQQINVQGRTTQPFSQIIMIDCDNSQSGADVTFYFPDTTDTLVVPAYSAGLFPVFTNGLLMYVAAPLALDTDITRFRVLNYLQAPLSNPVPEFHDTAVVSGIDVTGVTNIIPASVSGTLVGYSVFAALVGATAGGTVECDLIDHASNTKIDSAVIGAVANTVYNGQIMNVMGAAIRFAEGIDVKITTALTFSNGMFFSVATKYRTP